MSIWQRIRRERERVSKLASGCCPFEIPYAFETVSWDSNPLRSRVQDHFGSTWKLTGNELCDLIATCLFSTFLSERWDGTVKNNVFFAVRFLVHNLYIGVSRLASYWIDFFLTSSVQSWWRLQVLVYSWTLLDKLLVFFCSDTAICWQRLDGAVFGSLLFLPICQPNYYQHIVKVL